ncbi:MAG: CBS domain-containing protein [Desulforhopalus sp.]
MYISEYMTANPITVTADMLLPQARRMLNEYYIRHLPVVDRDMRLIGIVTDRDLRSAYPSTVISKGEKMLSFEQVEKTTVADIMTTSCSTLYPDASIDDALVIFDRDKVGGIPVINEDEVVLGLFSLLDLTAAYRKLFGVAEQGSILVGVKDDGRENMLTELVVLLDTHGIPLTRLIRLNEKKGATKLYLRINSRRPSEVIKLLKKKGFVLLEP